jgi:hypothetical protein
MRNMYNEHLFIRAHRFFKLNAVFYYWWWCSEHTQRRRRKHPTRGKTRMCDGTAHRTTQRSPQRDLKHLTMTNVVLYGCETWSLILREEHRLRVFENRVLRRIFGPKRDEETGDWRKLHNEELHNLYSSPSTVPKVVNV